MSMDKFFPCTRIKKIKKQPTENSIEFFLIKMSDSKLLQAIWRRDYKENFEKYPFPEKISDNWI